MKIFVFNSEVSERGKHVKIIGQLCLVFIQDKAREFNKTHMCQLESSNQFFDDLFKLDRTSK